MRKPTYTEISEYISLGFEFKVQDWEDFKDKQISPEEYLSEDPMLINALEHLAQRYTLVLITNNTQSQTMRILSALGINDHKKYFKILKTKARKPNAHIFRQVARELSVSPEQCVSIGDSFVKDVKPALSLGMRGVTVSSIQEFIEIAAALTLKKTGISDDDFLFQPLALVDINLFGAQFMPPIHESSI